MSSHSNIIKDSEGVELRKEIYELGELVTVYYPPRNTYLYGIIINIITREWVTSTQFQRIYTIALQNNDGSTTTPILHNKFGIEIYLPSTIERLKEQQIRIANRSKGLPC